MKAIFINAEEQTVEEVEHKGEDISEIQEMIGCRCFTVVSLGYEPDSDGIFIDDEGLLRNEFHAFRFEGYPQPLAGNGLILGCDYEGRSVSPKMSLQEAKEKVSFMGLCHLG